MARDLGGGSGGDAGPADSMPMAGAPNFTRQATVCTLPVGGAEGPVWSARDQLVIVSSLEDNRLYTCHPETGEVRPFRTQANGTSANAFDPQGHLVSIEQGVPAGPTRAGARLMRTTAPGHAGPIEVMFDRFPGTPEMMPPAGRFNRPNDLVITSTGAIYFTDPHYANASNTDLQQWEGLYRISADRKNIAFAGKLSSIPNGIALSPDERTLYVNARQPNRIMRYAINADGSLGAGAKLIDLPSSPDGMGTDAAGNVYVCSTNNGTLRVFSPTGQLLAQPGNCTNLAFGGADMKTLYLVGGNSVRRMQSSVRGLP